MFCDLVGSTALSTQLDPEDLGRVIADFRAACANAVAPFGGSVAKYMGDGASGVFRLPGSLRGCGGTGHTRRARAGRGGRSPKAVVSSASRSFASALRPGRWWSAS